MQTIRSFFFPQSELQTLKTSVTELTRRCEQLASQLHEAKLEAESWQRKLKDCQTELQEQIYALTQAREQAERSNQTKTDFLASMSHEIRTPMTSVLGFADLIAQCDLAPETRRTYVEKIQRNGRHLLAVIDDILDLSKIEAGHMVIHRSRFALLPEIAQAVDLLREQAEKRGLSLTLVHENLADLVMVGDQVRVRQILLNLVGNALKFTDNGGVTVTVRLLPDRPEPTVEVKVIDSGIGIDPSAHSRLFLPFSQANLSAKRQRAGTGLGLALARHIARALGGEAFLVESQVGIGSTFAFELPLTAPEGAQNPPLPNPEAVGQATQSLTQIDRQTKIP